MIVSFSWNDWSWKSTIIKEICSKFKKTLIVDEFSWPISCVIKSLFSSQKRSKKKRNYSVLYFIVLYIDSILEFYYYKFFKNSYLILKDRHQLDYIATLIELWKYKWFLKFAFNNFPKSDLSIYIDVSFDIAYMRRKSQLGKKVKDEKFYKNKNKIYSKLVNGNNSIITVSNNSKLVHDSVKVIKDHINKKILLDWVSQIVISGIDGAWKTTTINNLKIDLEKYWINYVETHFYYNYIVIKFIKYVKNIFGIKNNKTTSELYKESINHEINARKKPKSIVRKYFVLTDSLFQYAWIHIRGFNKLKLIDRYFMDYIVSRNFLWISYNKSIFSYMPKAKNYFLLVAQPEILYQRKPEHTLEFFNICYDDYISLVNDYKISLIDTSYINESEVLLSIYKKLEWTIEK